jgi:hypothetical protein
MLRRNTAPWFRYLAGLAWLASDKKKALKLELEAALREKGCRYAYTPRLPRLPPPDPLTDR